MSIPRSYAAENIASGYGNVSSVMNAWMNSPGHRANILSSSGQMIGIGYYNAGSPSWVQLFTGGYSIRSIDIVNFTGELNYGSSIGDANIIVYVTFTNGMRGYTPLLDSMITGYDKNTMGTQKITINLWGSTYPVTVEVVDLVRAFVNRLYTQTLARQGEQAGIDYWTQMLKNGTSQGAKVAQGFIDSAEFRSRSLTDRDYVTVLYRTFFDREPDSAGFNDWIKALDSGLSRLYVFKGFAESNEFSELCNQYHIIRGNAELTAPMDQNSGVTKFVARCYKLCLGRKGDEGGLNDWCNQILTRKNTPKQVAYGFIFSNEFTNKNLSDKEYVQILYRTFMDREAESEGLSYWLQALQSGQSRLQVFNGFADSSEFARICASYGL